MLGKKNKDKDIIDEVFSGKKSSNKKKYALAIGVLTAVVALLACGVAVFRTVGDNDDSSGGGTGGVVSQSDGSSAPQEETYVDGDEVWQKEGSVLPVKYDDWQLNSFVEDASGDNALTLFENNVFAISTDLPKESAGFTSDKSKAFDESGGMNPLYSYWTDESFKKEVSVILERFFNPYYGGWTEQMSPTTPEIQEQLKNKFSDVYTPRWLESDSGDLRKNLPVLANWDGTDKLAGIGWVGTVDSGNVTTTYDETRQQYSATLTANVTFSSYVEDGSVITKHGVLTLSLVDNSDNPESDKTVLVDSSTLEVSD